MIRRIREAIRRWWRTGGKGNHAKPRYVGGSEFVDVRLATIPRKPVCGRPPWGTAPLPAICLFPQTAAPALSSLPPAPGPELHPIVAQILRKELGTECIAEYVERLFSSPLPAAA